MSAVRRNPLQFSAEIALALAIVVPPFIFGGREAVGQLVLAMLALCAGALALVLRLREGPVWPRWRRPEVIVPLAALALIVITTLPLPAGLIRFASPGLGRLLPEWTNGGLSGLIPDDWHFVSLVPALSREAAFLFLVYAILFWSTLQVVRDAAAARRLFNAWFLCGVAVAVCGLMHFLFGNGKFYGLWELWWVRPEHQVRMPFTNRNHFAGFLALTLAPALFVTLRPDLSDLRKRSGWKDLRLLFGVIGILVIGAAIFLSQSRGGVVAALVALALAACALGRSFRRRETIVALIVSASAVIALVVLFGAGEPWHRIHDFIRGGQPADVVTNGRLSLWWADLHALADFPLFGAGAGSHPYVYPLYLESSPELLFSHAENGYVQIALENGLAGLVLLIAAIAYLGAPGLRAWRRRQRSTRDTRTEIALIVSVVIAVALVHGLVDFVWYVPAYAASVAVIAGLARGFCQPESVPATESRATLSQRAAWAMAFAAVAIATTIHFGDLLRAQHAWAEYRALAKQELAAGEAAEHVLREELACLARAASYRPGHPETLLRIAELRQRLNQPSEKPDMSCASFCQALRACPLLGSAYLQLARHTAASDDRATAACLREALLVRPSDASLCFALGNEYWRHGKSQAASACWHRAVGLNPALQVELLSVLASHLSAEELIAFWQPDFAGCQILVDYASRRRLAGPLRLFAGRALAELRTDSRRGGDPQAWLALYESCRQADLTREAEESLHRAIASDLLCVEARIKLIDFLQRSGRPREAQAQFEQAFALFPENSALLALRTGADAKDHTDNQAAADDNRWMREGR